MLDFMGMEGDNMEIAVLSGKGGTGKTLISVNLAAVSNESAYIDCDVEEPNGHLFFKPRVTKEEEIYIEIPKIDNELCNGCRKCVDFCKFNALAYINNEIKVFEDICHSCGGCKIVCPENAITEKYKMIGKIERGYSENVNVSTGILNTGLASGIPIINKLLEDNRKTNKELTFIDCPPGSACIVMDSIKGADYCIIVAEPTIFGVHNLNMVYELVKLFNKPFGVVLNKCVDKDNPAEKFCLKNKIKILKKIPYDKVLGKLNSDAKIVVRENKKYRNIFNSLLDKIKKEVANETTSNS